jgi:RNA polymerase sigma factor (sigma-70 family)
LTFPVDSFDNVLLAARAGADWAWERLYADLAPRVIGYLRARGAAEPEDLAGEAFLQVVRDLPRFTGDERDFRAWVFTIVHRRLVDERRRHGRRPADPAPPEEVAGRAGAGGDVAEEAMDQVAERRARHAIAQLPRDQQAVMLLRILGDMTVEEVARAMGKRVGAVKALQRRALRRIEREGLI